MTRPPTKSLYTRRLVSSLAFAVLAMSTSAQDLTISNTTYGSGQNQTIGATNTITTSGTVTVASGASIQFQAGTTRVTLGPGFTAQSGSYFRAFIAPDATAPTVPMGLSAPNPGATSFTLTWLASSDSFGVTAYQVSRDGVVLSPEVSGTSFVVNGLTANTTYQMTVKARDAAGNYSAASSQLSVTTAVGSQADSANQNELNIHLPPAP